MHDVRPLVTMLRGVNFGSDATITISEAGLTVSVEESKILLGRAYIPLIMFDEYKYNPLIQEDQPSQDSENDTDPSTMFEISLDTLLECLNIFGTGFSAISQFALENRKKKSWKRESDDSGEDRPRRKKGPKGNATLDQYFSSVGGKKTGMRLSYRGAGYPLVLILAEEASGPTTTCEIQTLENDLPADIPFDDARRIIKIILRSSWLRDALEEIDSTCDKLTFMAIPPTDTLPGSLSCSIKPTFRLSAEGTFGSSQMDYPNDKDVLESYECVSPVKFSYRVSHISSALRALQTSTKTSLRIDDEGLLSLQFLMAVGGRDAFIELRCQPLDDPL